MIRITPQEMHDFSRYIAEISGIALDEGKKYLLENRLQPILTAQSCSSFYELLFSVKNGENSSLRSMVVDAIATNETYFFRDQAPFEIIRHKIIPEILDRRRRQDLPGKAPVRIWCAGCSTGQEVYSVIIAILETVPNINSYDIRVLGTDISNRVIAQASAGRYSAYEVERGLPPHLLQKYFLAENGSWRVRDEVRALAGFGRMNLLEPFYGIGPFDLIMCRNVSIYFSEQNKVELFKKVGRILDREGYLIVGGSESLNEVAPQFSCHRHLKGMYYQRKDRAATASPAAQPAPLLQAAAEPAAAGPVRTTAAVVPYRDQARGGNEGRGARRTSTALPPREERIRHAPPEPAGQRTPDAAAAPAKQGPPLPAGISDAAAEAQPLLASIRSRRQQQDGSAWEKKRQEEGSRSLLEVIHERNNPAAATDDSTAEEQ